MTRIAVFFSRIFPITATLNVLVALSLGHTVYDVALAQDKTVNHLIAWHPTEGHVPLDIRVGYGPMDFDIGSQVDCTEFLKEYKSPTEQKLAQIDFLRLVDCQGFIWDFGLAARLQQTKLWFGFTQLSLAKTFVSNNRFWLKYALLTKNVVIELLNINYGSPAEIEAQILFQNSLEKNFGDQPSSLKLVGPRIVPDRAPIKKALEIYSQKNARFFAYTLLYDRAIEAEPIWPEQKLGFDTYFDFTHDIQGESPFAINYPKPAQMVAEYQQRKLGEHLKLSYLAATISSVAVASVQAENQNQDESKALLKNLIYGDYQNLTEMEKKLISSFISVHKRDQNIYWPLSHPAVGDPWDNPFVPSLNTYPFVGIIFGPTQQTLYALVTNISDREEDVFIKNDIKEDGSWTSYHISDVLFSNQNQFALKGTRIERIMLQAHEVLMLKLERIE